jgi:SAM-dependent methyltransferase
MRVNNLRKAEKLRGLIPVSDRDWAKFDLLRTGSPLLVDDRQCSSLLSISIDVFEHIPDPYEAFSEIHRILKPGGRHIFTVPFYGDRYRDEIRATTEPEGIVNHILPPIYHGDPIQSEGILVYVIFSMEMLMKLDNMGYQVRMYNMRDLSKGILGNNAIIFDTIKK